MHASYTQGGAEGMPVQGLSPNNSLVKMRHYLGPDHISNGDSIWGLPVGVGGPDGYYYRSH